MATLDQLVQAFKNAHAAGDVEAATRLAKAVREAQTAPDDGGMLDAGWKGLKKGWLGMTEQAGFNDPGTYSQAATEADAAAVNNPFSVGLAQGLPKVGLGIGAALATGGTGVLPMLAGAATMGIGGGAERYSELQHQGVDPSTAMTSAVTRGGVDALSFGIPASIPGKLASRFMTGAAAGVATNELDVATQNAALGDKYKRLHGAQLDPASMAVGGLLSGTVGAAVGPRPGQSMFGGGTPRPKVNKEPGADDINLPPRADIATQMEIERLTKQAAQGTRDIERTKAQWEKATTNDARDRIQTKLAVMEEAQADTFSKLSKAEKAARGEPPTKLGSEEDTGPTVEQLHTAAKEAHDQYNSNMRKLVDAESSGRQAETEALKAQIAADEAALFSARKAVLEKAKADKAREDARLTNAEAEDPNVGVPFDHMRGEEVPNGTQDPTGTPRPLGDGEPTSAWDVEGAPPKPQRQIAPDDIPMRVGPGDPGFGQVHVGEAGQVQVGGFLHVLETALNPVRAGLDHLVRTLPMQHPLSVLSQRLLENKFLNPELLVTLKADLLPHQKEWGGYHKPGTNSIHAVKEHMNNPEVIVHESVHRATYFAIEAYNQKLFSLMSRAEISAAGRIGMLYRSVMRNADLVKTILEGNKHALDDIHEFTAYGLSNPRVALQYRNHSYSALTNIVAKLKDAVNTIMGFSPSQATVYNELMKQTEILIREATAVDKASGIHGTTAQPAPMKAISDVVDRGLRTLRDSPNMGKTQDQVIADVMSGNTPDINSGFWNALIKHTIGKDQLKAIFEHPLVMYTANVVRNAETARMKLLYKLKDGVDENYQPRVGKNTQSLQKAKAEKSLRNTLRQLTDMEGYELHQIAKRFFDKGGDVSNDLDGSKAKAIHEENMATLKAEGVSDKMLYAYDKVHQTYANLREFINATRATMGQRPVSNRPAWFPALRKGKFAVHVFHNDIAFHTQLFRTELEAKGFIKKQEQHAPYMVSKLEDLEKTRESLPNLDDVIGFTNDMFDQLGLDPHTTGLYEAFEKMTGTGGLFGKHHEYRQGLSGYAGSEWFMSKAEIGASYKQAIMDGLDEQTSILTKNKIQAETSKFLIDSDVAKAAPNAMAMANRIKDMGLNAVPQWGWSKAFDKTVRDWADNTTHYVAKNLFGKEYYPKINPLDKTLGVSSTLFYLSTLTNRPGFWISQVLTSPAAIRHMLRDTDIPLVDIAKYFTKGTFRAFGGMGASESFAKVIHHMVNNTDSIHPLLQNELNAIGWLDPQATSKMAKVMRWATGQAPAEYADTFSRYWTASFMHEYYVGKGYKGDDLAQAVVAATDSTMVLYNRSSKGSWVQQAGLFGQNANPLLTFGTAQLGNLVADMKFIAKDPAKLRSYLPFLSTFAITQLMAGSIGLPLLVEYEFLRDFFVKLDPSLDKMLPSIKRIMIDQPAVLERGVVSAATGFDVGSGMRWNPFLNKFLLNDNQGLIDIFPVIAFMGSVGGAVGASIQTEIGGSTAAEKRKKMMAVTPLVGGKALVDELYFDAGGRSMVPSNTRSHGLVEQTGKERLSTVLGSQTVEKAKATSKEFMLKNADANIAAATRKYVDQITDGIMGVGGADNSEKAINKLIELRYNGEEVNKLVRAQLKKRVTTAEQRRLMLTSRAAQRLRLNEADLTGIGE